MDKNNSAKGIKKPQNSLFQEIMQVNSSGLDNSQKENTKITLLSLLKSIKKKEQEGQHFKMVLVRPQDKMVSADSSKDAPYLTND